MKKLITLLVGMLALTAMSFSSVNAAEMKCGAGKCGAAMSSIQKPVCCDSKANGEACTCDSKVKCSCQDKKSCECEAGKKAPKAAMKCGNGKCG